MTVVLYMPRPLLPRTPPFSPGIHLEELRFFVGSRIGRLSQAVPQSPQLHGALRQRRRQLRGAVLQRLHLSPQRSNLLRGGNEQASAVGLLLPSEFVFVTVQAIRSSIISDLVGLATVVGAELGHVPFIP